MWAWTTTVGAVLRRPSLWPIAVGQSWRMRRARWWRRSPYLPLPERRYLRFRMVTQYGDADHAPDASDVVSYLTWCRDLRRCSR